MRYLSQVHIVSPSSLPKTNSDIIKTALTDLFIALGALSFLMILVAALMYIFSGGKAEDTAKAKNMIMYSAAGLVLSALAAAIVTFVTDRLSG